MNPQQSFSDYDFIVIMIQNNEAISNYSLTVYNKIYSEFWKLLSIVISASVILSGLIGLCVFWATKRITTPIEKLTKLTQDIKKEHKIEEIRKKIWEHELFKEIVERENAKDTEIQKENGSSNKSWDEIEELISIFYHFFIDESNQSLPEKEDEKHEWFHEETKDEMDVLNFSSSRLSIN